MSSLVVERAREQIQDVIKNAENKDVVWGAKRMLFRQETLERYRKNLLDMARKEWLNEHVSRRFERDWTTTNTIQLGLNEKRQVEQQEASQLSLKYRLQANNKLAHCRRRAKQEPGQDRWRLSWYGGAMGGYRKQNGHTERDGRITKQGELRGQYGLWSRMGVNISTTPQPSIVSPKHDYSLISISEIQKMEPTHPATPYPS